jgi:membrane-associated phospholipid phosphatase
MMKFTMKSRKFLIIMLFFLFSFHTLIPGAGTNEAKEDPESQEKAAKRSEAGQQEKQDPFFKALIKDEAEILTSPLRMSATNVLLWGGVSLITGILIANDEAIYQNFKDYQNRHEWVDKVSPVVTQLGDGFANLGIAGGFYLGGLIFRDGKAKDTARLLLMTFIHTGFVVQLGKHLSGRQRPSYGNGTDHWYGPSGFFKRYTEDISKYDAFPSGHTITAWGTATVIAKMYKDTVVVPILCYSLATMVGLSRVTEDTHWLSDVFLGAALGYAIGKFVTRKRRGKWLVLPLADSQQMALSIMVEL